MDYDVEKFTKMFNDKGITITSISEEFGISRSVVRDRARRLGLPKVGRPTNPIKKTNDEEEIEQTIITEPYPNFKIKPFPPERRSRDEEDIGIVIADWHIGKKTTSYDSEIAKRRIGKLLDNTMTIINLHRPIRKVHIFDLGDNVQGENPKQGSKIGDTEFSAYEQIHDFTIPYLSKLCVSLLQGVAGVDLYGISGNHGVYERTAPDKTNWDAFVYRGLEMALKNQKGINIYPPQTFYQLVNVRGFRFFVIHGNQVFAQQGIPMFALRRKMQEWYAYVGGFNFGYCAHFHSGGYDQVNSLADYTIAPPLVTGDSWALEKVGRASEPRQLCFGIHNKYGRTWEYKLHTDDAFLPKKFDEVEGLIKV